MGKKSYTIATATCPECGYEGKMDSVDDSFDYEYHGSKETFCAHHWECPECSAEIPTDLIAFDEVEPDYYEMRREP